MTGRLFAAVAVLEALHLRWPWRRRTYAGFDQHLLRPEFVNCRAHGAQYVTHVERGCGCIPPSDPHPHGSTR